MRAFTKQYGYNTEVELTRKELKTTRQMPNEGFTEYLRRFRDKASMMRDRPSERDQIAMIIRSVCGSYKDVLFGQEILTFDGLRMAAQQVKDALAQEELPKYSKL